MNPSEIAERAAREIYGISLESAHNRGPEFSEEVIASIVERAIEESQAPINGLRFTFECGCASTFWAETGQLKGGLSCCKLHETNGQTLPSILEKCPMMLVRIGTVAA